MSNVALMRTETALLVNQSGGNVAQGDVVIVDPGNPSAFTTTTTVGYTSGLTGVVLEPNGILSGANGMVAFAGYVPKVNLSGSASLGDLFKTHSVAKQAVRHAAPAVAGDFGMVLATGTTPAAILFNTLLVGGGDVSGPGSSVAGNIATFGDTSGKLLADGGTPPGRVLISEQTPSGVSTVTFGSAGSLTQAYKKLILEWVIRGDAVSVFVNGRMRFNGDNTDANYRRVESYVRAAGTTGGSGDSTAMFASGLNGDSCPTNEFSIGITEIIQYANTGFNKHALTTYSHKEDVSSIFLVRYGSSLNWLNTAAINQIDIVLASGNFKSGSVLRLYGEN